MTSYQPPQVPPQGYLPHGTQPVDGVQQTTYYPGPSDPYAPSKPAANEANEAAYAAQWKDRKEKEYGAPMQIKKKRVNDVFFLILFVLQVSHELFSSVILVDLSLDT